MICQSMNFLEDDRKGYSGHPWLLGRRDFIKQTTKHVATKRLINKLDIIKISNSIH